MKFVKMFYVTDVGEIKPRWINVSYIQNMNSEPQALIVYDSTGKNERKFSAVYAIKTDSEVPGYIDASKPFEIKDLQELYVEPVVTPKRGRPAKHATGQNSYC